MADMFSREERSRIMRLVRGKHTRPELALRSLAHKLGYRFRLHRADLPGKPDLVFPSRRKVVFMHGCWWHGHYCSAGVKRAKSNAAYWRRKIRRNMERDTRSITALRAMGWRSLVVWECETKSLDRVASKLRRFLEGRWARGPHRHQR